MPSLEQRGLATRVRRPTRRPGNRVRSARIGPASEVAVDGEREGPVDRKSSEWAPRLCAPIPSDRVAPRRLSNLGTTVERSGLWRPQRRVRLFIFGSRIAHRALWPEPTHAKASREGLPLLEPWVPLGKVLRRCEPLLPSEIVAPPQSLSAQLDRLAPGKGLKSPGKAEATRPGGHWGYTQGGFLADPSQPARTITASAQQDWVRDPRWGTRRLSPRECAAVQTFPSDWKFPDRPSHAYRVIGNAVPPALAEAVGRSLLAPVALECADSLTLNGLEALPRHLESAIEYTAKEEARNGPSRQQIRRGAKVAIPHNGVLW